MCTCKQMHLQIFFLAQINESQLNNARYFLIIEKLKCETTCQSLQNNLRNTVI